MNKFLFYPIVAGATLRSFFNPGQNVEDCIKRFVPSPSPAFQNVATLSKYDYHVNHFTGVRDNLFEVNCASLVPKALSFSVSDLKPNQRGHFCQNGVVALCRILQLGDRKWET